MAKAKFLQSIKFIYLHIHRRPEVNAVVHCHPVFATAIATAGEGLTKNVFPEVVLTLGKVPLCKYATPSTDELPLSMEPFIDHAWAFLFQNHGAVTLGRGLTDAYFKMEKLEQAAKTIVLARIMGGEKELPEEKVNELYNIAKSSYGLEPDKKNIF